MSSAAGFGLGPIRVRILEQTIGGKRRAFVDTPAVGIGTGATKVPSVMWSNETSGVAKLWFPNGDELFNPPASGFSNPIPIKPGETVTLEVKGAPTQDHFHYHVYCEVIKRCAEGHSEPVAHCP